MLEIGSAILMSVLSFAGRIDGCWGRAGCIATGAMNTKVGGRVKDVRTSFATACKRAGITNFHPHDLRHTFASWLVMDGVPLYDVSKVMRHSSIEMTQRYAHLAPDHLHSTVSRIKTSAQFQHTGDFRQLVAVQNGLNKGINGRGERI